MSHTDELRTYTYGSNTQQPQASRSPRTGQCGQCGITVVRRRAAGVVVVLAQLIDLFRSTVTSTTRGGRRRRRRSDRPRQPSPTEKPRQPAPPFGPTIRCRFGPSPGSRQPGRPAHDDRLVLDDPRIYLPPRSGRAGRHLLPFCAAATRRQFSDVVGSRGRCVFSFFLYYRCAPLSRIGRCSPRTFIHVTFTRDTSR